MNDQQAIRLITEYRESRKSYAGLEVLEDEMRYYNDHAFLLCELARKCQQQAFESDEVLSGPSSLLHPAVSLMDVHTHFCNYGVENDQVIAEALQQQAYRHRRALARIDYVTSRFIEIIEGKPKFTWEPKELAFV